VEEESTRKLLSGSHQFLEFELPIQATMAIVSGRYKETLLGDMATASMTPDTRTRSRDM
jgi:hypothetical protein